MACVYKFTRTRVCDTFFGHLGSVGINPRNEWKESQGAKNQGSLVKEVGVKATHFASVIFGEDTARVSVSGVLKENVYGIRVTPLVISPPVLYF